MSYSEFICLDIETTGFNPTTDEAIEVAAIKFDINGNKLAEIDLLLSSDTPIPALVISLTGIRPEDLAGQPRLKEVADQIRDFVGDLPIVGHNITFDIDFLNAKGLNLVNPLLDTLELAQTILPAQSSYGLESLSHRFGLADQPSHRAIDDVRANIHLFHLLTGIVQALPKNTHQKISTASSRLAWNWQWLFEADLPAQPTPPLTTEVYFTDYLIGQLSKIDTDLPASASGITLIENHQSIDDLAAILRAAGETKPSLVILPPNWLRLIDWAALEPTLGYRIGVHQHLPSVYEADLEDRLLEGEDISTAASKLFVKLAIWNSTAAADPAKLYLTSEETYEWEQSLITGPDPVQFSPANDVTITTAQSLRAIATPADYHIFTLHPFYLEDTLFDDGVRVFSVPYFSAAISSRRELVHREIAPEYPRIADEIFKLLGHMASNLTKLQNALIDTYNLHPPVNIFEKDIEITREHFDTPTINLLTSITDDLSKYLEKLTSAGITETDRAYQRSAKLLDHLSALRDFRFDYKYFLYAEPNKFYLQLIPVKDGFSQLQTLFASFAGVTVVSPGLSFVQSFAYWHNLFGAGSGKIINPASSTQLMLPIDLVSDDGYEELLDLLDHAWATNRKVLVVAGSGYDSHKLLEFLHHQRPEWLSRLGNHETIGLIDKIPGWLAASAKPAVLIVAANWLEKGRAIVEHFDMAITLKVAFESGQRPLAKLNRGERDGFSAFTLPRATMRFKEQLGWLARGDLPIILLDPRLDKKDYGSQILSSLDGLALDRKFLRDIKENLT